MTQLLVSVIIPVGPAHLAVAGQAVASALRNAVRDIEVIVVNDTRARINATDPRVRVIHAPPGPGLRPAVARNAGLAAARGTFVLHLDADDYLLPDGLAALLRWYAQSDRAYVYGLHYSLRRDGSAILNSYGVHYDAWDYTRANLHAVSALVPRALWLEVGGFDAGAAAWDDWTGYARLRRAGHCGDAMPLPAFVYRHQLGTQHTRDDALGETGMQAVRERIIGAGWNPMPCGCGGAATAARQHVHDAIAAGAVPDWNGDRSMRVLEYIGPGRGTQTYRVNGRSYRAGNNAAARYLSTSHTLVEEDIEALIALGVFREIPPPPAFATPPDPGGIVVHDEEASVVVSNPVPGDEASLDVDASGIARPTEARRARASTSA